MDEAQRGGRGWQERGGPRAARVRLGQRFDDVRECTASAHSAYTGFRAAKGPAGGHKGKSMSGHTVLRCGSCVTSKDHAGPSERNFSCPGDRWRFPGNRLADGR